MIKLAHSADLFPTGKEHYRDWQGLDQGSLAVLLSQLAQQHAHLLVVLAEDSLSAQQLHDSLHFYLKGTDIPNLLLPDWETLPYDLFSPHQDIISDRIQVLHALPGLKKGILITPVNTVMQRIAPRQHIDGNTFSLRVGDTFDMEATRLRLAACGYRHRDNVYEHGEYAVRGAIMDIFPMGADQPFRIELFDDEIESLRLFDAETQRSTGKQKEIRLLPAAEYSLSEQGIATFKARFREEFDVDHRKCGLYQDVSEGIASPGLEYYLPLFYDRLDTLFDFLPAGFRLIESEKTESAITHFWEEITQRHEDRCIDTQRPILPPHRVFVPPQELATLRKHCARARLTTGDQGTQFGFKKLPGFSSSNKTNPFVALEEFVLSHGEPDVLVCAETEGRREALLELMQKRQIQPTLYTDWRDFSHSPSPWGLTVGEIDAGFWLPEQNLVVIAESQLYGERVMQRRRRKSTDNNQFEEGFRSLGEMTPGTPVVHIDHGVGRYKGLEHLQVDGQKHEFLVLEYANQDKLYVPVTSLHLISRYGGADHEHAPITRLGSDQWQRARQKAAEKIHDVAAELLNIYARREARQGKAFSVDPEEYERFTQGFPFEETPDQQSAIRAVISDMQLEKPMDRLICGDVGFGKTEVAMRAAFVAIQNHTQVAVLVPTTLLAQQHFQSFQDRFANLPVNIALLSRFKSAKEKEQTIADLASHKVDIVIGTHQLLQDQISFKSLGLVIVDEEHRFGVRHKERLKQMRAEADILTMTATPIPRTLNMAMSGMRDISIIATPPDKRLSVKTFVQKKDKTLVKEAIMRELLRGGQVYFLHNDIATMEKSAEDIREMVPDARVAIAHGQMRERELESIMSDFYHRRFNVLLCTTIIETGIDVPSANTIIIERADKFGLAQLHQLRGRVGRSHHQAYAFLLTPGPKSITKDAAKRLEAIEQASDLGAGFMLASHDLEIRGAGELLGDEQSGHIETIGFSLYMEMLEQAVESLKRGETPDTTTPLSGGPEVNLHIPALIPDEYLPDVFTRLTLYKRIAGCKTPEALKDLQVEMIDRFGLLPYQVKNLVEVTLIRQRAEAIGITRIDISSRGGRIEFSERTRVNPLEIVKLVQSAPSVYRLEGANKLKFTAETDTDRERIEKINALLDLLSTDIADTPPKG